MGHPPLSDEERGRTRGLHEAGVPYRQISIRFGRSIAAISQVLNPPKPSSRPRGRPRKLDERTLRRVIRRAGQGGTSSSRLKAEFDLPFDPRILADTDFLVFAKMEQTLDLTPEHKAKRIAFAKLHLEPGRVWNNVIFSGEKKFNRDGPDDFKFSWKDVRRSSKTYNKHQMGGGSIMFWAGICWEGKTQLVILEGSQNSEDYMYTIGEYMLPFAHLKYGTGFIFQQDNAPIHVSKKTKAFFAEVGLEVLDWPARSPDLNPIENHWATMARRVYKDDKQYDDLEELREAVLIAWESISLGEVRGVIESMPRRCIEVIERKGDKTHY